MLGFLNIYKPSGVTSSFVVQKIKKKFKPNKIGHLGTLDPLACGVLPIAVGKATRLFDYSLNKTKRYTAVFDFGYTTDTLDTTGVITEQEKSIPSQQEIISILPFLHGDIDQLPPLYSAKNVNGQRAYNLARKGIEFELKPKKIFIYKLELLEQISENQFKFDIICSSGTYIRAVGRDIANSLGTCACMSFLERTETGTFTKENSIQFEDILKLDNLEKHLISPIDAFSNFDIIDIDSNIAKDLIDGKKVPYEKITKDTFIICSRRLLGVAKKDSEFLSLETYLYEEKGE